MDIDNRFGNAMELKPLLDKERDFLSYINQHATDYIVYVIEYMVEHDLLNANVIQFNFGFDFLGRDDFTFDKDLEIPNDGDSDSCALPEKYGFSLYSADITFGHEDVQVKIHCDSIEIEYELIYKGCSDDMNSASVKIHGSIESPFVGICADLFDKLKVCFYAYLRRLMLTGGGIDMLKLSPLRSSVIMGNKRVDDSFKRDF